jgi:hypothetical protein
VTRQADGGYAHADTRVLPGGTAGVFTVLTDMVGSSLRIDGIRLETGKRIVVLDAAVSPHVTSTGHLLYGNREGQILAEPLDLAGLEIRGPPSLVADGAYDIPRVAGDRL